MAQQPAKHNSRTPPARCPSQTSRQDCSATSWAALATICYIGNFCDKDCKVVFTQRTVTIHNKNRKPFLRGWRELVGAKLRCIPLKPDLASISPLPDNNPQQETTLNAFSAYDLPSVEALVIYFHAAARYPVRSTWLRAIEAGNFASFPGLTLANAMRVCP